VGGVSAADDDARERERRARVALAWLSEPGDQTLGREVERRGAAEVLDRIRAHDRSVPGGRNYAARLDRADADASIVAVEAIDGRVVVPGDGEWPTQLDDLGPARPLVLFVRGADLRLAAVRSVAVVGARAATAYGVTVAADLAAELAASGWTVVSGGAYGIDAAAHRGALSASGATVAVLACGIDVVYPRGHATLLEEVATRGTVTSELPPGSHPTRSRFLERNRVIAGLTRGTVVVEAAVRSGALNTAGHAAELGRPVLGVPGPVTSAASAGVHRLFREAGAEVVVDAAQVIEALGVIGDLAPQPRVPHRVTDGLDPVALRVFEALPANGPMLAAQVCVAAGLDPVLVGGALNRLAVLGLVVPGQRGWRLADR
jgi:DNA processing protein